MKYEKNINRIITRNFYIYSNNDPINFIDPTGLKTTVIWYTVHPVVVIDDPKGGEPYRVDFGPQGGIINGIIGAVTNEATAAKVSVRRGNEFLDSIFPSEEIDSTPEEELEWINRAQSQYNKGISDFGYKFHEFDTNGENMNCIAYKNSLLGK